MYMVVLQVKIYFCCCLLVVWNLKAFGGVPQVG